VTKYQGEAMVREAPLRSLSIRLPGVIGRASVRNWLTGVVHAAKHGQTIALYNPEGPFNNAIHIDDLCRFTAHLVEHIGWNGHDAVTVGAAGLTTVRRAVETIIQTLGSRSPIVIKEATTPGFTISIERNNCLRICTDGNREHDPAIREREPGLIANASLTRVAGAIDMEP
jgi:nucleoside-diphosphate-sugar epimerase